MDEPQQPPQPVSPQHRLKELRAIPERDRTDAQWDEMNELEIMLASANRAGAPDPNVRRDGGGGANQQRRGGGQQHGGKPGHQGHRGQNRGRQRQR
jgi:hypothetical protein